MESEKRSCIFWPVAYFSGSMRLFHLAYAFAMASAYHALESLVTSAFRTRSIPWWIFLDLKGLTALSRAYA